MKGIPLLKLDKKNISRDFILFILLPVPLLLALLLKWGFSELAIFTSKWLDLYAYSPLFLIFLIVLGPLLTGMVSGLMLVDEADENIIPAIAVTPLGRKGYMLYRLTSPLIWSFLILLPVPIISGLAEINYLFYIPIILLASLGATLEALLIAVLAGNKIEAMAMGKVTGILFIGPFIGWFAPSPWKFFAGVLPSFWVSESYFSAVSGSVYWPINTIVGLLISVGFILVLLKKYNSRAD